MDRLMHIERLLLLKGIITIKFRVAGLWSGIIPNMMRNSIMNAAELASYDQIKSSIIYRWPSINPDKKTLHFLCALMAGFIAVVVASPVDVIKTRVMNVEL